MRDLEDGYKISVRGIREVAEALDGLVTLVKHRAHWKTHEDKPSKPGRASVVNALLLWVDKLPREEKVKMLVEGHAMLDACLGLEAEEGEPPVPGAVGKTEVKVAGKEGKRKRG